MTAAISYSLFDGAQGPQTVACALSVINDLVQASRWKLPQFIEALTQRSLLTFLAHDNSEIIGYAIFSLVAPEAHLVNIALAPKYQQQGIGSSFFNYSLEALRQKEVSECWLEVRESNMPARNFYKKANFVEVQKRKDFYEEPKEDAWLMVAKLIS